MGMIIQTDTLQQVGMIVPIDTLQQVDIVIPNREEKITYLK
jgi:hypothetical protein